MKKRLLFIIPLLFIISCSNKTAEEYYNTAEQNLKDNKIPEAVQGFENLVSEFPKNKYSAEALYKLATIYQAKQVKDLSAEQSLEKAAEKYRTLQEKFPKHEKAPVALFMAAYIKANELKQYPQATELYNLFLKKYPKHELASSAKQELDIMGLSPDEVLKKKTAGI